MMAEVCEVEEKKYGGIRGERDKRLKGTGSSQIREGEGRVQKCNLGKNGDGR